MNGHDFPEDFDPDREQEIYQREVDDQLRTDVEYGDWSNARHDEAREAQDKDAGF